MDEERARRVRLLPDGEELVAYEAAPAPPTVAGEDPRAASAERRHRALAERRREPRNRWPSSVVPLVAR